MKNNKRNYTQAFHQGDYEINQKYRNGKKYR